jgi:YidC/Oxa1 family membrane protein insertase
LLSVVSVQAIALLNYVIQKKPWVLVDYITRFLGFILNVVFNLAYALSANNSLGWSIIILTVITKVLMIPISIRQQKSMDAMQKLQPEIEKIKKKYGNSKDPEIQQKMNTEIQGLYSKNKVNPLGGCLPAFLTLPIFLALNYIIQQSYIFITKLGDIYAQLTAKIMEIPGYIDIPAIFNTVLAKVPPDMSINPAVAEDMRMAVAKFSPEDWTKIFDSIPAEFLAPVQEVFQQKLSVEMFFGIDLVGVAGLAWPGVLIPILAVVTAFLSQYLQSISTKSADDNAKTQQKVMLIVMPLMMGFFTISMSSGVGVYWIASSVFQLFQQMILGKQRFFVKKEKVETK